MLHGVLISGLFLEHPVQPGGSHGCQGGPVTGCHLVDDVEASHVMVSFVNSFCQGLSHHCPLRMDPCEELGFSQTPCQTGK